MLLGSSLLAGTSLSPLFGVTLGQQTSSSLAALLGCGLALLWFSKVGLRCARARTPLVSLCPHPLLALLRAQVLRIFYLSRTLGPFVLMLIQMFYDVYIWLLLLVPVLIGFTAALVVTFRDAGSCVSTQDGFSASAFALLEIMLGRCVSWRSMASWCI